MNTTKKGLFESFKKHLKLTKQEKDIRVNNSIKDNEQMRHILEKEGIDFIYF